MVSIATKVCPACEATFHDGTFCELCGETLVSIAAPHTGVTGPPTLPVAMPPADVPLRPSDAARPLADLAPSMTKDQALDVVAAVLRVAAKFERDALAWQPQPEDFRLEPSGEISLAQARAVGRLLGQPFDVRRALWAVREALVPGPLVKAGAEALRFVAGRTPARTVAAATSALDELRRRAPRGAADAASASACDIGLLRERNEDAAAVERGTSAAGPWTVLVVCDGVSSSSRGDLASSVGAATARERLVAGATTLPDGATEPELRELVAGAIHGAHAAIVARSATEAREPGRDPPGTTIVAALVAAGRAVVGWAGDSRAYVVSPAGDALVTHDHSWLNHALAMGTVSREDASAQPMAHALTRCIGPLELAEGELGARPEVAVASAAAPGWLVLCSDGLWSYLPSPEALAEVARGAGANAGDVCDALVAEALARGGQDNVAVAVCALGR